MTNKNDDRWAVWKCNKGSPVEVPVKRTTKPKVKRKRKKGTSDKGEKKD